MRTLSVDDTAVPPEAEPIEDPQTPDMMAKPVEHPCNIHGALPLSFAFSKCIKTPRFSTNVPQYRTIYHNAKARMLYTPITASENSYPALADSGANEAGLTTVGDFDTGESYCQYFT